MLKRDDVSKTTISLKTDIKEKLRVISGLTNKSISDIINDCVGEKIDYLLEESKKSNKLI